MEYEERIIAFIDLLGFKALVQRLPKEKRLFQRLKKALNQFSRENMFYNDNLWTKDELKAKDPGREVSNFSDTIVISYSTSIPTRFSKFIPDEYDLKTEILISMIMDIMGLYVYLTPLNLPIRGSISIEKLYHTDDVIFGDALVSAYDLEREDAIYPRVIMDEKVLSGTYLDTIIKDAESKGSTFFIGRDSDQRLIFDHLLFAKYFGFGAAIFHLNQRNYKKLTYQKYMIEVRKLITNMMELGYTDQRIKQKADWYIDYFNNHISKDPFSELKEYLIPTNHEVGSSNLSKRATQV